MSVDFRFVPIVTVIVLTACGGRAPAGSAGDTSPILVVGEQLSCLVREATVCRGGNPFLRTDAFETPAGEFSLATAADLAIGDHHACLLADGVVACWGSSLMGQLGATRPIETCIDRPCSRTPVSIAGLPVVRAVAAGAFHTVALAEDGSVWGWGANAFSQVDSPPAASVTTPKKIEGIADAIAVSAGNMQSFAVLSDGSVVGWGNSGAGRLGVETDESTLARPTAIIGLSEPVAGITVGDEHACALLQDDTVECWGNNRFAQLGDGTTESRSQPAAVEGLPEGISEIAAGGHFTCARTAEGEIFCWGWNDNGQLGQGSFDGPSEPGGFSASPRPVAVKGLPGPATALAAGPGFACALIDDSPWCWGRNEAGQLGHGGLIDSAEPVRASTTGGAVSTPRQSPRSQAVKGLDVSYHSGRVDWDKVVAQDFGFAFTLSTAGLDFHDPYFDSHWQRMRSLRRGAYHFFVAHDDPEEQARWFIANTPLAPGDLAPVVDIETLGEDPPDDLADRLKIFVDLVHSHFGVRPIVYTGPTFWDQNLGRGWGDHALWIAEYEVDAPKIPAGWQNWTLWQDQGNANLDGVERIVDLNRKAVGFDLEVLALPSR